MPVGAEIQILKYYLGISKNEQRKRLRDRRSDPLKQWKTSPIDMVALKRFEACDCLLTRTSNPLSRWISVRADDKHSAHLTVIRDLLSRLACPETEKHLAVPDRNVLVPYGKAHAKAGLLSEEIVRPNRRNTMSNKTTPTVAALAMSLAIFVVGFASAQPATGPTFKDTTSQHHQMLNQMMKDMTQEMTAMTDQMSRGELTPEQNKQMSERMAVMANVMRRMSGLGARPHMKEADWQKQMDQMRKQMDNMMQRHQ